ncbi:MAG: NAD(+) synthase [Gammaproteobacteria bacterium]
MDKNVLTLDAAAEIDKITTRIREILQKDLKKRGLVVAISGGVDSAVCAALCVRAIGAGKVFGLLLPEHDSSSESVSLGEQVAQELGIQHQIQNIAPTLEAIGCYRWRDEAIRHIFPDYTSDWKSKIVIAGGDQGKFNYFQLVVQSPDSTVYQQRMDLRDYLQIVAATNFKQRVRKTVEYFHADRLNYAVVGTPNRLEYDQGFFVKNGDGSADLKPIAHLYKTQVYQLAHFLGLPDAVCNAQPTTDTYSMAQGQDEFYFVLPYHQMDLALWAMNHDVPAAELAEVLEISVERAEFIYKDIQSKRRTTHYQHARPSLIEPVPEIA